MKLRNGEMKFWDIFRSEGVYGSGFFGRAKKYFYDMPDALPWGGWSKWDAETKAKYPISWFFLDTIPDFIWGLFSPFRRWYPHFRSKYIRKDHHLILDVERLSKLDGYDPEKPIYSYHWRDSDTQIQWALAQIMINYVENEKDIIDWAHDPRHQEIHDEFMEIYRWWTEDRLKMIEESEKKTMLKDHDIDIEDIMDISSSDRTPEQAQKMADWDIANKKHDAVMNEVERIDTEMMIRTITIRGHLWS